MSQISQAILDSVGRAVVATDISGVITFWNNYAKSLYGWSADEAVGKNINDVISSDMIPSRFEGGMARLRSGAHWEGVIGVKRKNGMAFSAYVSVSPILDADGAMTGVVGISHDIADELEHRPFLHSVVKDSLIPTAVTGADGAIISFNTALESLIGYTQSEISNFADLALKLYPNKDYRQFFLENIQHVLDSNPVEGNTFEVTCKGGAKKTLNFHTSSFDGGLLLQIVDVTEHAEITSEREATLHLLKLIHSVNKTDELMELITRYMHDWSGCEAVGIRLQNGDDYPYFETSGFDDEFVRYENSLCAYEENGDILRDTAGNAVLECMCGNIIRGRFDPSLPFFTAKGSFWTNSTTELLASTSEEDRQARTRNRCNGEGYESVALVPLRAGKQTFGLLQFNDPHKGKFSPSRIETLERLALNLALGLSQRDAVRAKLNTENTTRSILDASPAVIALLDRDGKLVDFNASMQDRFHLSREGSVGTCIWDLMPQDIGMAQKSFVESVFRTGKPEYLVDCRDGICSESTIYPVFDENGDVSNVTVTSIDVTETKEAEEALRRSEEKYRAYVNNSPEGIFVFDGDGHYIDVNEQACRMTGYSMEELLDMNLVDLISPNNQIETGKGFLSLKETGFIQNEVILRKKDGTDLYVFLNAVRTNEDRYLGFCSDITDKRLAERATLESEKKFRTLYDNAPLSYQSLDEKGCFIDVNPAWLKTLGYTRDEVLGKSFSGLMPTDMRQHFEKNFREFKRRGTAHDVQFKLKHKDGHYIDVSFEGCIGHNPDGSFRQTYGVFKDISRQKKVEESLRQHQYYMEKAQEISKLGSWDLDIRENRLTWTDENYKVFGVPLGTELTYEIFLDCVHPDDREQVDREWNAALKGEPYEIEHRLLVDGEVKWVREKAELEFDENGACLRGVGFTQDITERKKSEELLQKSEQKYRQLFTEMMDGFSLNELVYDDKGNPVDYMILEVNQAFEELLGAPCSEIIGKKAGELLSPAELKKWIEIFASVVLTGKSNHYETYSPQYQRYFEGTAYWAGDRQFAVTCKDITERKTAEESIKQSEQRLKLILNATTDAIWDWNIPTNKTYFSPRWFTMLGFKPFELPSSYETWESLLHPHDRGMAVESVQEYLRPEKGSFNIEFRMKTKDGGWKWIQAKGHAVEFDEEGMPVRMLGSHNDIHDRKVAEEALRQSEERFRKYFELGLIGMAMTSVDKGWIEYNDVICNIFGYSREEFEGLSWADLTFPDDLDADLVQFNRVLSGEINSYSLEKRFIRKDGGILISEMSASAVRKKDGSVDYFVVLVNDITERRNAEESLKEKQHLNDLLLNSLPYPTMLINKNRVVIAANRIALEMGTRIGGYCWEDFGKCLGLSEEDRTRVAQNPHQKDIRCTFCKAEYALEDGLSIQNDANVRIGDMIYDTYWVPMSNDLFLHYSIDVTERRQLENELAQSQKMESIGRLAGGVAHDFNNIIQAITLYCDLSMSSLSPDNPLYESFLEIQKSSERAAELTSHLLAFSRRQIIAPKVMRLDQVVNDLEKMLRRLINENIEFSISIEDNLWHCKVDKGQIGQVITNMVVNSRDALPNGGKISLHIYNDVIDGHSKYPVNINPGDYVVLSVSDTGIGMDAETQTHIFEPFFTTKGSGKGTGLGLSTCYGIVKQNNGYIWVSSEPGKGSSFLIYLPRIDLEEVTEEQVDDEDKGQYKGTETILLVEDEHPVLLALSRLLSRRGYTILTANNGEKALEIARQHKSGIDMLLTDVVMPRMGGKALSDKIQDVYPDMKILFMSGYTDDSIVDEGVLHEGIEFLPKPIISTDLLKKVREILDG